MQNVATKRTKKLYETKWHKKSKQISLNADFIPIPMMV